MAEQPGHQMLEFSNDTRLTIEEALLIRRSPPSATGVCRY